METEVQEISVAEVSPLHRVTPLSKYLAMALFVAMPFIGGWIGYTYAPEKIIEVEKFVEVEKEAENVVRESKSYQDEQSHITVTPGAWNQIETHYKVIDMNSQPSPVVVIDDLNVPFRETLVMYPPEQRSKYVLEKIFESDDGESIYFKGHIPYSSACCSIVKFDLKTLSFTGQTGFGPAYGEGSSPNGRYISDVSAGKVSIIDILTDTSIKEATVTGNETLSSSYCGYAGDTYDLKWISDNVLEYGVYDKASLEKDMCEGKLIEKRRLTIE